MKTNNVLGIVFANVHDDFIHDLTKVRSMALVPAIASLIFRFPI